MTDRITTITKTGNPEHDEMTRLMALAFERALARQSQISLSALAMEGMSGRLYRMWINNLIRFMHAPRYLEVGSWAGSTACAVMDGNAAKILCIDNWSQFEGPKDQFFDNVNAHKTDNIEFQFIESDFRKVDVGSIGKFNIYLFDGPHEAQDQYDGLALYKPALDDNVIFLVDDWNWPFVRSGTLDAIRDTGFRIDFAIEIRSSANDEHAADVRQHSDWHNGYLLAKLSLR